VCSVNLIGVYLMFNNNTITNQSIYENQLSTISSLIDNCKSKQDDFIVVGAFNGDINRNNNKFDKTLNKFLKENNLISVLDSNKTSGAFTYSNSICNSLIDYILVDKVSLLICSNCFIDYNKDNTSDHNSINAMMSIDKPDRHKTGDKVKVPSQNIDYEANESYRINWSSDEFVCKFYDYLETELLRLKINNIFYLEKKWRLK
jgi:hypothetical protein